MNPETQKLVNELLLDPSRLDNLTEEDAVEVKKNLNFYGVVVPSHEEYANISVTNLRDRYLRDLHVTALIGFLYRVVEEYCDVRNVDAVVCPAELRNPELSEEEANAAYRKAIHAELNTVLGKQFRYNPDRHVSDCYKDNLSHPRRREKYDEFRKNMSVDSESAPVFTEEKLDADVSVVYNTAKQTAGIISELRKAFTEVCDENSDLIVALNSSQMRLDEITNELYPYVLKEIRGVGEWTPPVDVYHHFDRYLSNHYEIIREVVDVLRNTRPDIDFAIQYYGSYASVEEATIARKQSESKLTASVYTISNEGWHLLGPFKANNDRVDYYNKNTDVLKQMMEQTESDHKLGADLMKKRVAREKKRNIEEAGPDAPGLAAYKEANNTISELGAKEVLTDKERDEFNKAVRVKEMEEVPDDAIQVDVFKPTADGSLVRDKFYTQAEAPEFMEDNIAAQKKAVKLVERGYNPDEAYAIAHDDGEAIDKLRESRSIGKGKAKTLVQLKKEMPPAK